MTVFIDTAVVMYAAGSTHDLRPACRKVLTAHSSGHIDAVTSAEVVQEILHRFSRSQRGIGDQMADATLRLFNPVLAITHEVVSRARVVMAELPGMQARDALHVATCLTNNIRQIVTPDTDFDGVPGLSRVDPRDLG